MNELTNYNNNIDRLNSEVSNINPYELYTNSLTGETKRSYSIAIRQFFGVKDLSQITVQMIQSATPDTANRWALELLESGLLKSSVNNKLSALHNFYNFLCRRNVALMTYNPFAQEEGCIRYKNTNKDFSDNRTLSPEEVNRLIRAVDVRKQPKGKKIIAMRDLIILEILVTTGLRRAELCGIKIGDIQLTQGHFVIRVLGKGNKYRLMVLAEKIKGHIDTYLKMRGVHYSDKDLPLLVSHSFTSDPTAHIEATTVYRAVKKYAKKAGIDPESIHPHTMRHTFATTGYNDVGLTKDELQELMGHSSSTTTSRYIKSSEMIANSPADKLAEMYDI